ncbi:putative ATP-dependent RNA helicase DHX57 [Lates japonicus]|uniref:ATP-dependent RNA helicase DHX57 n=1 Tax=Lates japonicus TaxID=270547 RepID=A0AAD3MF16_LATJO|nr:putative ATP-dependent RNA helicase DHX57 [Lates japonicus]
MQATSGLHSCLRPGKGRAVAACGSEDGGRGREAGEVGIETGMARRWEKQWQGSKLPREDQNMAQWLALGLAEGRIPLEQLLHRFSAALWPQAVSPNDLEGVPMDECLNQRQEEALAHCHLWLRFEDKCSLTPASQRGQGAGSPDLKRPKPAEFSAILLQYELEVRFYSKTLPISGTISSLCCDRSVWLQEAQKRDWEYLEARSSKGSEPVVYL